MFYIKEILTQNNTIPLTNGTNIITGYTGQNKTLLYTAVNYVFCVSSKLGIKSAIKSLSSNFIGVKITNGVTEHILKRTIQDFFEAYIDDVPYKKMNEYKKTLNSIFLFTPVKISCAGKNNTFNVSDFLDFVFIPENQLTSQNNVFEKDGYSEKAKNISFFIYILTGLSIDEKINKKSTDLERNYKKVFNYRTAVNYVLKPKKDETRKRESIIKAKEEKRHTINDLIEKNRLIEKILEEKKISVYRLNALKKSYESDLSDCIEAGYLEEIEKMCESDQISQIDYSYYSALKKSVDEISQIVTQSFETIDSNVLILSNNKERIKELELEVAELDNQLKLSDNIRIYDECINTIDFISGEFEKAKKETAVSFEKEKENINSTYKDNLNILTQNVKTRLKKWGIDIDKVEFDYLNDDFLFDGEAIKYLPKGRKSIYTFALNIEIYLISKSKIVNIPGFIMVDSLWVATNIKELNSDSFKETLIRDIETLDFQTIIFENENQSKRVPGCNYYDLDIQN